MIVTIRFLFLLTKQTSRFDGIFRMFGSKTQLQPPPPPETPTSTRRAYSSVSESPHLRERARSAGAMSLPAPLTSSSDSINGVSRASLTATSSVPRPVKASPARPTAQAALSPGSKAGRRESIAVEVVEDIKVFREEGEEEYVQEEYDSD